MNTTSNGSLEELLRDPALARLRIEAESLDLDGDDLQHDPEGIGDPELEDALRASDRRVVRALQRANLDPGVACRALARVRERLDSSLADAVDALDLAPSQVIAFTRVLQTRVAGLGPVRTEPHFTYYEWAGNTLARLYGTTSRPSETWPFFSGRVGIGPASLSESDLRSGDHPLAGALTLRDLVRRTPEMLGPAGIDPESDGEKAFFVKLLDPSAFPPFAWVGFDAEALARIGASGDLRHTLLELLVRERETISRLRDLLARTLRTGEQFARLRDAYRQWAIDEALAGWSGRTPIVDLTSAAGLASTDLAASAVREVLTEQLAARRGITALLHRVDLVPDRAVLIPSPTLHGIAGMSGQMHPRRPDAFFPKDEAWIHATLGDEHGAEIGWALVEPQRSFDRTESAFDFFTPFAWGEAGLVPRKRIERADLERLVASVDATSRPAGAHLRVTTPVAVSERAGAAIADVRVSAELCARTEGNARWWRVIDEPDWPHFAALELRTGAGGGAAEFAALRGSFAELHVTSGRIRASFAAPAGTDVPAPAAIEITARGPVLLPATLGAARVRLEADGPARLLLCYRPDPRSGSCSTS